MNPLGNEIILRIWFVLPGWFSTDMIQFLPSLKIVEDGKWEDDGDKSEEKVSQPTSQHW